MAKRTAPRYTPDFPNALYRVAYDREAREYTVVRVAGDVDVAFYPGDQRGYQQAYEACAALNTEAAIETRAVELDAEEDMAALHPRYAQRGGDVVDTGAGRWYCTLTAWPYSPAARDGAELGRAA